MRKITLVLAVVSLWVACKSGKPTTTTTSTEPTDAQLNALKTQVPSATMDDLKKGHAIYYGACTNCHKPKNVSGFDQDRLKKVVDNMSAKSKLSDADKEAVWRYALSLNLASKGK